MPDDRTHYAMHCALCDKWEHLCQCFDLVTCKKIAYGRGWTFDGVNWICPGCEMKVTDEDGTVVGLGVEIRGVG
jgi:hypothetical protein